MMTSPQPIVTETTEDELMAGFGRNIGSIVMEMT